MPAGSTDNEGQTGYTKFTDSTGRVVSSKYRIVNGKKVYEGGAIYPNGMVLGPEERRANAAAMAAHKENVKRQAQNRADARASSRLQKTVRDSYQRKPGRPAGKVTRPATTTARSSSTVKTSQTRRGPADRFESPSVTGKNQPRGRIYAGGGGRRAGSATPKRDAGYVKVGLLVPGGSRKKSSVSPPRGASTGGARGSAGISRVGSMSMRGTGSGISAQQGSSYVPGQGTRQGGGGSRMRAGKK